MSLSAAFHVINARSISSTAYHQLCRFVGVITPSLALACFEVSFYTGMAWQSRCRLYLKCLFPGQLICTYVFVLSIMNAIKHQFCPFFEYF